MCHNIHNDSFQICVCFASFASAASACDDEAIKHFYTLEGNHNETQQTISVPAADAHSGGKPVRLSGSSHRPDLPEQQGRPGRVRARSDGLGPARRHQRHATLLGHDHRQPDKLSQLARL